MPTFATVLSGFTVSSPFTIFPADRGWAISVPSMAGNNIRVDFSATSGGAGDFGVLHAAADQPFVAISSTSRPCWGTFQPVTPFARVSLGAAAADTASFALFPVN